MGSDHHMLTKPLQLTTIRQFIHSCDLFVLDLTGYDDRPCIGASRDLLAIAEDHGAKCYVVDPKLRERVPNKTGHVAPMFMQNLYGFAADIELVKSFDEVILAISQNEVD